MITSLAMGAGIKIVSNVINSWMQNSADERKANAIRDEKTADAHIALAKQAGSDSISKIYRGIIFLMLTGTWCYIAVYGLHNPELRFDVLVPRKSGWSLLSVFSMSEWEKISISGSILMFQWFQLMEMVVGFFVVPSRKR